MFSLRLKAIVNLQTLSTRRERVVGIQKQNFGGSKKIKNEKPRLLHTRSISSKSATGGEAHIRGLTPGQHSSEETSQRWRAVGNNTVSALTGPGNEPDPPHQ